MRITTESLTFVNPSASLVQIYPINIYMKVNFKFMTALYSTNQNFNQKCNIEKIQNMYLVNLPCTHGTT